MAQLRRLALILQVQLRNVVHALQCVWMVLTEEALSEVEGTLDVPLGFRI